MSDKKVWIVCCTVEVEMAVVAETRDEAEEVAVENIDEELDNNLADRSFHATPLRVVPEDMANVIPWGEEDASPRRDWTVEQWLAELNKTPPGLKSFKATLLGEADTGVSFIVWKGAVQAVDRDAAHDQIVADHWDERLRGASCSPVVRFDEHDSGEEDDDGV
jgi:hypothetical protein